MRFDMSQTDTDKVQQEGNMASSSVKDVNDPRQQQHTQPSTPPSFSATMAAAAADHSEAAVSGEEMDDASFFNLTPSPDKSTTTKRAASEPPTKPLRFKSPAGTPKARSRQSSPAPAADPTVVPVGASKTWMPPERSCYGETTHDTND